MIRALCVDDTDRPNDVSVDNWIVADNVYHITHVNKMVHQGGILGFVLKEINIDKATDGKFSCFKASRFGVAEKDLQTLVELAINCGQLSDIDILAEINKEVELYPVEVQE